MLDDKTVIITVGGWKKEQLLSRRPSEEQTQQIVGASGKCRQRRLGFDFVSNRTKSLYFDIPMCQNFDAPK